jgi:catalase (peroxidase I)
MTAEELISSMGYGWKYETTESSARLVAEHAIETMYSEEERDEFAIEFAEWLFNIDKEALKKQLNHFKEEKGL